MIHAKDLFPLAMDRIRDHLERGHTQTAKARALLDAFDEGEGKGGKREGRKASDRGAIRVKEKRARQALLQFN